MPAVASRLEAIAPGWTVERLKAWVARLPEQLARAYRSRAWKNLGWWAKPDQREGWARMEMSLRGRGRALDGMLDLMIETWLEPSAGDLFP